MTTGATAEHLGIKSRVGEGSNRAGACLQAQASRLTRLTQGSRTLPLISAGRPPVATLGITLCSAQGQALQQSSVHSKCTFSTFPFHLQILYPSHWLRKGLRTHTSWLLITHLLYIFTIWMRHRIGGMGGGKGGQGTLG